MKFSIKDFLSKCDQIRSFLWIWSYLLNKSLMKNFIFCAVKNVATAKKKKNAQSSITDTKTVREFVHVQQLDSNDIETACMTSLRCIYSTL